jgi:hypothetical protein
MMGGIGEHVLPRPSFSPSNPYWIDYGETWKNIYPMYRPRNTAQDFLYASRWEIFRPFDVHGAYCVRTATVLTARVNWRVWLHNELKSWKFNQIGEKSEKTA